MRASGGCCCAGEHYSYSARRLLGGGVAAAPVPSPAPLDAERARLERALCAAAAVLFVASVSYVALSTLVACFRTGGRPPPRAAEETKRALEEIPVVVVVAADARDDPDGGRRSREGGAEEDDSACAVCLAEYARGEEVRVLPACRHGFHRACVDRWLLARAPTCPVCRAPVVAAGSHGRGAKASCAIG